MVDVVVVGGGPAGCTAARLLAGFGYSVAMVTRPAPSPALAESLPPSAVRLLARLGWGELATSPDALRVSGNTYLWPSAASAAGAPLRQGDFPPDSFGLQIDRERFDAALLRAVTAAGVRIISASATAVDDGTVHYRGAQDEGVIPCRRILDCSGRTVVAARRGWRRAIPRLRTLAIARMWERDSQWPIPDPAHTVVERYENGWAWSVPLADGRRCIAVMVDARLTSIAGGAALEDAYRRELEQLPGMRALMLGARPAGAVFARDASPYTADRFGDERTLLVGDAATFVDPLSSYGVKKALASAWLAAVVTRSVLDDPSLQAAALALYERRERAMFEQLERRRAELAGAETGSGGFWEERAEAELIERVPDGSEDAERAIAPGDMRAALQALRAQDALRLVPGPAVRCDPAPLVRDDRIHLEPHVHVPRLPHGMRYVRNVDVLALLRLAPASTSVPEMYAAYGAAHGPAPLHDFLWALSFMVAAEALVSA